MQDTVHLAVVDRWGNMVSATPSGGFMSSAPVIAGLGFPTSTRGQMMTLELLDNGKPGAKTIRPGARPRTTLSPTLALKDGKPDVAMAFGTPGADGQDQWSLTFFLRVVHHGMAPQQAIDFPSFSSSHFPSSFGGYANPLVLGLEGRMPPETAAKLEELGHKVNYKEGGWSNEAWTGGMMTAVGRHGGGQTGRPLNLWAAANPRGMNCYAVGR